MKYLHKFATQAQFESYYNGENYEEPFVGLIAETSGVSYNKGSVPPPSPYLSMPLTVEVTAGSCELYINKERLKYKKNDGNWTITTGYGETINVTSGDVIQFKQDYERVSSSSLLLPLFSQYEDSDDFRFIIYGNVMSIYSENGFENLTEFTNEESNVFENLFGYCNVISAENLILPVTSLTEYCYSYMFNRCYSLTTAPELPSTTLADSCYHCMFSDCTELTTAPSILPATTLVDNCYYCMFDGCTSLNYIKCLATDISATYCTSYWVQNVSPTGTFVKNPNMSSWTTGDSGIPNGWTVEDAS